MIYHVDGSLDLCEVGGCVIDCCGVGYRLAISDNTYSAICAHVGERMKLLTYLQVREDGVELFGFKDADGADEKAIMKEVVKACKKVESDCEIYL